MTVKTNVCLGRAEKKRKKKKNQFNLFQRLILLPSELIKLLALYAITFVLMHIFKKWCLHLGPTKKYVSIFLYLLLSTAIVKNPNSLMLFHYLTLQLNWTRWVYNTLWGQPGTCIILLLLILVNFVLIAINWFGQSLVSSPEMTRIAKIAFCAFCVKTKKRTTTTTKK